MLFIKDYVEQRFEAGEKGSEIAKDLAVSTSMISAYRRQYYNPSLDVAKIVYKKYNIVLHPFAKESLELELADDIKYTRR